MPRPQLPLALVATLAACAPPPEVAKDAAPSSDPQPAILSRERPMTTTPASTKRPPLDLRAPAATRTATFALG